MPWLTDPKSKQPSVTMTLLVAGFVVATLKLLVASLVIGPVSMAPFSGTDFAAVVASLGGIYGWRKWTDTP